MPTTTSGAAVAGSTIGILGGHWRATVSDAGSIRPWDGSAEWRWFIAADDRWHCPPDEPTRRQRRIDGTAVVETRIKVPSGDAVHRTWCVADHGGVTIVEIENDSSLPFAVAFDRSDLLSGRAPAAVPIEGIDLPAGSVVFPVGHHTSVRFGVPHDPAAGGASLERLPSAAQVVRGWTAVVERAGRAVLPDAAVPGSGRMEDIARFRCELALNGPTDPGDDPVAFLIGVGHLVRLGEQAEPWIPDIAAAVSHVARLPHDWAAAAALDGAAIALAGASEDRALRDLARLRSAAPAPLPAEPPGVGSPDRRLAWHELTLARAVGGDGAALLGGGIPANWHGADFEVHGLPIGPVTTVSYAVRWHGERPAILWEQRGQKVRLTAPSVAGAWSTTKPKGEALWPPQGEPPTETCGLPA